MNALCFNQQVSRQLDRFNQNTPVTSVLKNQSNQWLKISSISPMCAPCLVQEGNPTGSTDGLKQTPALVGMPDVWILGLWGGRFV
jgi:hypothetical protein